MAALALLPTASASAGGAQPATEVPEAGIALYVSPEQLETAATVLPTGDLGLETAQLEALLKSLPALQGLGPVELGLLPTLLAGLAGTTSLGALEGVLGVLGVDVKPLELLEALKSSAQEPAEVARVLSDLAGALTPGQMTSLEGILGALAGHLSAEDLAQLQTELQTLLAELGEANLTAALQTLEGGLSGTQLGQLQALLGTLGSLSPTELKTKLGELLGGLEPTTLGGLVGTLFGVLDPSQLQGVVGELLQELPFSPGDTGELAGGLGMSLQELASQVGVEPEQLEGDLSTLTAPLGSAGEKLTMVKGLEGLNLDLLGGKSPSPGEESKGSGTGGSGGSGSNGGSGGSGGAGGSGGGSGTNQAAGSPGGGSSGGGTPNGSGGAGSTTVTLVLPGTSTSQPSTGNQAAKRAVGKVKVLAHRVRGRVATLVLQVPAAGRLSVTGAGARAVHRQLDKAQRVTVKVALASAGAAALRRHHGHLTVKLRVAFAPVGGSASRATTRVRFA